MRKRDALAYLRQVVVSKREHNLEQGKTQLLPKVRQCARGMKWFTRQPRKIVPKYGVRLWDGTCALFVSLLITIFHDEGAMTGNGGMGWK
jgi:hypothetical protein